MRIGIDTTFLVEVEILEHPHHREARSLLEHHLDAGHTWAIAPQVVTEFVHVVTDDRRFERPLTVPEALGRAQLWWHGKEVDQVVPGPESMALFWAWMQEFDLGRKRLLDTMLAATYFGAGVDTVATSNARDYHVFACFDLLVPGRRGTGEAP